MLTVIPFSSSYILSITSSIDRTLSSNHISIAQAAAANDTNKIGLNNQIGSVQTSVTLPGLFNKVRDAIVEINVIGEIPNHQVLVNDAPLGQTFTSSGSGFVYDKEDHVVTNYHVIQNSKVVYIRFLDGNSYLAKITGRDIYSDLAVLSLDPAALSKEQIKPLPLANSSLIQVGDPVVAIGSPAGLTGSMTEGIVSQTVRL